MRLQRLEINGFKSFSDRSELAFDTGVTAIVGPNGCGKSNVADAITWVLGEQSAKSLRGDRMEDVIFSGSDARKPGGTAEVRVRLTGLPVPRPAVVAPPASPLDETHANGSGDANGTAHANGNGNGNGNGHVDSVGMNGNGHGNGHDVLSYDADVLMTRDVEVTRRLYRSGESEYLIDGEVCRLRDIHELLMDTGLGAKAYSIIEQGKIGMILSSRPADRRQLIEEAAGITKYKSRRRAAELKLEAAQQNLTRVDDIVFEIEKQRGSLKRQAAKARRYRRLREELRRWEKVLVARRFRELSGIIDAARTRLLEAREREAAAAGRVAEVESHVARLRIEQAEADARAAAVREDAHAREIAISRQEQQVEFDRRQVQTLAAQLAEMSAELTDLESRRGPASQAIAERRSAAAEAEAARDAAADALSQANESHVRAQRRIEGLESDVEAARSGVFGALNAATALRHAMEHAAVQRDRVSGTLAKLEIEDADVLRQRETIDATRMAAEDDLRSAQADLDRIRGEIAERESDLASVRGAHESHLEALRTCEHDLARTEARLQSLVELEATRAEFGDAARMVLVEANGRVGQRGAVADFIEVDGRYERAVEACLGDLLQHVLVERHEHAAAGLALVREQNAGRCGFVVMEPAPAQYAESAGPDAMPLLPPPGVVPIGDVLHITGEYAAHVRNVLPAKAYIAEDFEQAMAAARQTPAPVATLEGDLFRGEHLVSGGGRAESRGILATKREIKELRERAASAREALSRMSDERARLEASIAATTDALAALAAEQHRLEKVIVGREAEVVHAAAEADRLARKADVVSFERRQAIEERTALEARHAEAQASIDRLLGDQRDAEALLSDAQNRLLTAREIVDALSARAAEARATHAAMTERAAALAADVRRLEDEARDMEVRIEGRRNDLHDLGSRREAVLASIAKGTRTLDENVQALQALREQLGSADEAAAEARGRLDVQDAVIRQAREALDSTRAQTSELDVLRVTAESDMTHLTQTCLDTLQCTLDDVMRDVEQIEQSGEAVASAVASIDEGDEETDDAEGEGTPAIEGAAAPATAAVMSAEEAITALKGKIDRLGPVNMMAIEQFDDLEARHTFLATQRADLIESMKQTAEAIKRIDETSKARFTEAFTAIQHNFQETFSTLFGGGRAGLTLLDENDPIESGIDIVASPPGKRLQNVQLLSGGEKALTAIALMFAIFRYKPSPFCLLDEIDAPLDDANVGRFVEMLRAMLDRTQFILITHNRRTMEIANRLYGVTMEEPGVSKLIAVQLN